MAEKNKDTKDKEEKPKKRIEAIEQGLEIAEQFGIDRKEVGKMLLASIGKGKLDLSSITGEKKKEKESGFEHFMAALVKGIPFYVALFILWLAYRFITHVWMP